MEIIATMGGDKLLVSVTKTEIAIIMGFDSQYGDGFRDSSTVVGSVIDVVKFAKISKYIRTLNTGQLKSIRLSVEKMSKELDDALTLADELQVFDILKDA